MHLKTLEALQQTTTNPLRPTASASRHPISTGGILSKASTVAVLVLGQLSLGSAVGAPAPETVTADDDFRAGSSVTVSGNGFGTTGPEIVLFEDFESGSAGERVSLDSPYIGRWSSTESEATLVSDGRSGNRSARVYEGGSHGLMRFTLPRTEREIFLSYWVYVPPGTRFPGDTSGPGEFSSDSSWKFAWIMDTSQGFHSNGLYDLVAPTFTGGHTFQIAGNSYRPGNRYPGNSWWSWDNWMRISVHLRDPNRAGASGYGTFEVVSAGQGYHLHQFNASSDPIPFDSHQYDRVNFPGWIRSGGSSNVRPQYDDIYVSIGNGAAARVELVDAPRYSDASRIELLLVDSWSDSSITATVPPSADLDSGDGWYVFVTHADGSRNSQGVTLCPDCPKPPVLLGD